MSLNGCLDRADDDNPGNITHPAARASCWVSWLSAGDLTLVLLMCSCEPYNGRGCE